MSGDFSHKVLFDFTAEDSGETQWHSIDDRVMGGCSQSDFSIHESGIALFQGTVTDKNGGGFASVRSEEQDFSLDDFAGVALHARGDGHRYQLSLTTAETGPSLYYTAGFTPSPIQWESIYLPFRRFQPKIRGRVLGNSFINSAGVVTLGFMISGGQMGPFCLQVDHIWAFTEKELHEDIPHDRLDEHYF